MNSIETRERLTIRNNWDIGVIEDVLQSTINSLHIWGDLDITAKEYYDIQTRIRPKLGADQEPDNLLKKFRRYPAIFTTDMICFVIFEYDNNNFWESWASRYAIKLNPGLQAEIGSLVLQNFEDHGFEIIKNEGYKYVSTILYQAGIPGVCYHKIFDILDGTLHTSTFSMREISRELIGYRSHLIDASVKRYFEHNFEAAVEQMQNLQDMMCSLGKISNDEEMPSVPGIPQRILQQYQKWCHEIQLVGRKNRRNSQFYISPRLVYDKTRGVCIHLPEQSLSDDTIYCLRWEIVGSSPDWNETVLSDVYSKNQNTTQAEWIPVPPALNYLVTLYDEDRSDSPLTHTWEIPGISYGDPILVFDPSGIRMIQKEEAIQRNGTTILYNEHAVTGVEKTATNQEELYLQRSWANYLIFGVYPNHPSASWILHTMNDIHRIDYRQTYDIDLGSTGTLFDENYPPTMVPVYIRYPQIHIKGHLQEMSENFSGWQVVLNHRSTNHKISISFNELPISFQEDEAILDLREWAIQMFTESFGLYDVRIYEKSTNRKQAAFYLAPKLQYSLKTEGPDFHHSLFQPVAVLFIAKAEGQLLEFDEAVQIRPVTRNHQEWEEVRTKSKKAYLTGSINLSNGLKIPFRKTMRKLEWIFWNEADNEMNDAGVCRTFNLKEFEEANWRIKLHFSDPNDHFDNISFNLVTAEKCFLQSMELLPDKHGNVFVTLNAFHDTMRHHPLPQQLVLTIRQGLKEFLPIPIASLKQFVRLENPRYQVIHDRPMIYWEHQEDNQLNQHELKLRCLQDPTREPISQPLTNLQKVKVGNEQKYDGIELAHALPNGVYSIDAVDLDDFSFDEPEPTLPSFDRHHLLTVQGGNYLQDHISSGTRDVDKWLASAIVVQTKVKWIKELVDQLGVTLAQGPLQFDAQKSAQLLFSAVLNSSSDSDLDQDCKTSLKQIHRQISDQVITNTQRTVLLHQVVQSQFSDEEIRLIIHELQLYLFMPDGQTYFDKAILHRIWVIDDKLAILINLRDSSSSVSVDLERVIEHIGDDILPQILTFSPDTTCNSQSWSDCFECFVSQRGACPWVTFHNSEKIWGNVEEYNKLFSFDRKMNVTIKEPSAEDTSGYPILGRTYLKLLYDTIQKQKIGNLPNTTGEACAEFRHIDTLAIPHHAQINDFESILIHRRGHTNASHLHFFEIALASLFTALETGGILRFHETQQLLPFWRLSHTSCSDLVARDLIMAELYAMSLKEN